MHSHHLAAALFSLSLGALAYTFLGYGLLIKFLARRSGRPLSQPTENTALPSVCVVLAAHNEEARIIERLQNLLTSEYPAEKLRIVLVSDGSTDETAIRANALGDSRVAVLTQPARSGKAAALNLALAGVTDDIVVLTDVRQRFAPDAIARLARHFSDPSIGAVSGALEIAPAASATGSGVDAYWRYEKALRAAESRFDSCIGCTGAIYAIRPELFQSIPEDTLLDDVVIPMQIAITGHRVIHDPTAIAYDPQALEPTAEQRRKQRTLAGNFQMLFRYPAWLSPRHNRLWWQLLAHKYLRLFAPLFLACAFIANARLMGHPFYGILFAGQLLLYTLAAIGAAGGRSRILALPAAFVFLNLMTLRGLRSYLSGHYGAGWK